MSKDGISKANHNLYSDENTRYSHLKDVDIRLFEKTSASIVGFPLLSKI